MLKGEGSKKKRDDMNLQELFKDLYSQAKSVDATSYVNSAKSSINSFSSLLEKRRQKAAATKKDTEEQKATQTDASKDTMKAEGEKVKEETT